MSETRSLASIDSLSDGGSFDTIYDMLTNLKIQNNTLRESLKTFNKRVSNISLQDKLLEPRPNARPWFEKNKLNWPCEIEEFLRVLFTNMAKENRISHHPRVLVLSLEEAAMFKMKDNFAYKWIEVLAKLPNVFY